MAPKISHCPASLEFRHLSSDFWQQQTPQLAPLLMGMSFYIWNISLYRLLRQRKKFCGQKSLTAPDCLKTWFWILGKHLKVWIYCIRNSDFFSKSTTKTMYIWFYIIDLWSQNQFLIDVARSLGEIVDVTFESRGLSGIRMSPTLLPAQEPSLWDTNLTVIFCNYPSLRNLETQSPLTS